MAMIKIPEQKVILCGEYGAGKSSIFRRFTNDTFVTGTDRKSTLGLDHFQKVYQVVDRDIKVLCSTEIRGISINFMIICLASAMGHRRNGTGSISYVQLL